MGRVLSNEKEKPEPGKKDNLGDYTPIDKVVRLRMTLEEAVKEEKKDERKGEGSKG